MFVRGVIVYGQVLLQTLGYFPVDLFQEGQLFLMSVLSLKKLISEAGH